MSDRQVVVPNRLPLRLACTLAMATLAGCAGGEDVNARTLARARRLWAGAGITNYNLEWASTGARAGHYLVNVRDAKVTGLRLVQPDGSLVDARPGDKSYYSIEGLFRTIEEDADQCLALVNNGNDRGVRVLLRFWPDEALGYPHKYRRDVTGSVRALAIDVLKFEPNPQDADETSSANGTPTR